MSGFTSAGFIAAAWPVLTTGWNNAGSCLDRLDYFLFRLLLSLRLDGAHFNQILLHWFRWLRHKAKVQQKKYSEAINTSITRQCKMNIVGNSAAMKIYIEKLIIIWCMSGLRFDKWASLGRIMRLWGAKKRQTTQVVSP